jgi:hypothetical protein
MLMSPLDQFLHISDCIQEQRLLSQCLPVVADMIMTLKRDQRMIPKTAPAYLFAKTDGNGQ